jgi:hypothetical protein
VKRPVPAAWTINAMSTPATIQPSGMPNKRNSFGAASRQGCDLAIVGAFVESRGGRRAQGSFPTVQEPRHAQESDAQRQWELGLGKVSPQYRNANAGA